ncbi:MAG: undecaprenyl-diphosphate phosphatase [Clostridia bacterium]|nr:undecaprenyl-diphosphate phosphatase [Clostridia bacterium]
MYIKSMLLGLVQGLTEFLPVSSSGHLAIFKRLFGADTLAFPLSFDILLHIGTLIAVFAVYYRDIWELIREFFAMVGDLLRGKPDFKSPYRRFVLMVIIATIPAVFAGLVLNDFIESIAGERLWLVGVCLFITAAVLYISGRAPEGHLDMNSAGYGKSFIVGIFQAVAILPGISRSGSTIAGGQLCGFKKDFAVKFSFIMSIPTILGAAVLDFKDVLETGTLGIELAPALLGTLVAALSGFAAIKFLLRLVQNKKLYFFSIYCIIAGIFTIILNFI